MNSIGTLATFFGWCTVINIGMVLLFLLICGLFHEGIAELLGKIFGVPKEEAKATLFRVLQQYRLMVVVLNLVPYIALKIMA